MSDDTSLLRRYAETREDAVFSEVVRRHLDLVYSAALRRLGGNRQLAEEATQQVFITLARKAAIVAKHPVITGWLHTATRNEAINVLRAEIRRTQREQEAQLMSENNDSHAEVDWSRVQPILDEAVDELSPKDRDAVMLRFFGKRSFVEISRDLGLSEDAARMRVQRALERLRVVLQRRGVSSSAAALSAALTANSISAAPASLGPAVTAAASACAAASGPAVAFGNFIGFMATSKTAIVSAGVLALAAGGMATWEVMRTNAAEQELARLHETTRAVTLRARKATARVEATEARLLPLREALSIAQREPGRAEVAASLAPARTPEEMKEAGDAFLRRHPEVTQALSASRRAYIIYLYRDFLERAQLTPVQIDDFVAWVTFVSSMSVNVRGQQVVLAVNGGAKQPEWMTSELLGEFERTARSWVSQKLISDIAQNLQFTDAPIRADQTERLAAAILATPRLSPVRPDLPALASGSPGVLSNAQLGALRKLDAQADYQEALNRARQQRPTAVVAP